MRAFSTRSNDDRERLSEADRTRGDVARRRATLEVLAALVTCSALLALCLWIGLSFAKAQFEAIGEAAKVVALALGAPAVIFGLLNHARSVRQHARADLWQRRQFVLVAVERFEEQPAVRAAMMMLDYNARSVVLPGLEEPVRVDDEDVVAALAPGTGGAAYSQIHTRIRDAFDEFFSGLDRLGVMMEAGLVSWPDIAPYIQYWLELLDEAPREREPEFGAVVRTYIRTFYYDALETLMERAGVRTFTEEDEDMAKSVKAKREPSGSGVTKSRPRPFREEEEPEDKEERARLKQRMARK